MNRTARLAVSCLALGLMSLVSGLSHAHAQVQTHAQASEPSVSGAVQPRRYRLVVEPDTVTMRFSGEIHLEFTVSRAVDTLALDSLGLEIDSARLTGAGALRIRSDEAHQRVLFDVGGELRPGPHEMVVRYRGRINEGLGGFFRPTPQAPIYASACCMAMARRIAPLWDEPGRKVVFALELIVDPAFDVVSNMPVRSREASSHGRQRVIFQPTPRMSPHQLFFAVGHFDRIASKAGPVELGVLLPKGTRGDGRYALAATREILEHLNERLALPYPLPKLDSVAFPSSSAGAIEYWGSILYADRYLAVEEGRSSPQQLQAGYSHVAHELSHQWFGDLVTSGDWRDNWLNEGFAEWLGNEVTDHFHPEWNVWLRQAGAREEVMQLDARSRSHPVVRPAVDLADQAASFDSFTYVKGSQVIRMLAALAGPRRFDAALSGYLRRHAYGSVSSDDLWRTLSSQLPPIVEQVGRDFTQQEGVPLIEVLGTRCEEGKTLLTLRQIRYGLDAESRKPRLWRVPVTAMTLDVREPGLTIVSGPEPTVLALPGCGAVKVNLGGIGYFRTRYDEQTWSALERRLSELPPIDQRNVRDDRAALAEVAGP